MLFDLDYDWEYCNVPRVASAIRSGVIKGILDPCSAHILKRTMQTSVFAGTMTKQVAFK